MQVKFAEVFCTSLVQHIPRPFTARQDENVSVFFKKIELHIQYVHSFNSKHWASYCITPQNEKPSSSTSQIVAIHLGTRNSSLHESHIVWNIHSNTVLLTHKRFSPLQYFVTLTEVCRIIDNQHTVQVHILKNTLGIVRREKSCSGSYDWVHGN